jgi:triacylglycerol lipase
VRRQAAAGTEVERDIAYGPDPRHRLDCYRPAGAAQGVLVYIPGGGFVGGDKDDGTFHGNIGRYFARHGLLTVIANYRLAPTHLWPSGAEDVAAAVAWARQHARERGADPSRLFLYGQSAGASHAASYLFDAAFHPAEGCGVTAAVLMSGVYRLGPDSPPPVKLYYGADPATFARRAPISHVATSRVPLLLSVAEYDPAFLSAPTYDLAREVTLRDGKSPRFAYLAGHNHVSTVMSLGTVQDDVGAAVRGFIANFP